MKKWTKYGQPVERDLLVKMLGLRTHNQLYYAATAVESNEYSVLKSYLAEKGENKNNFILWEGDYLTLSQVAKICGIEKGTLSQRIRRHGIDCEKTYFPGRMPNHMRLPSGHGARLVGKTRFRKRDESGWNGLGCAPRNKNVAKIKLGTWEQAQIEAENR